MSDEPFSHAVLAADIPAGGRHFRLEADAAERSALAAMLDIPAVEALVAEFDVRPVRTGYSVRGEVQASVVQTDVVSLESVAQEVSETVDVTLVEAEHSGSRRKAGRELVDADEADGPDVYHNGRIDLGIIAREHLALGLDPYPRAPDSTFAGHMEDDPAASPSPFAALAALKPDRS